MNLNHAETIARRLVGMFAPVCERIEIAGSIRRRKPTGIKDVELVAVPTIRTDKRPGELFAARPWVPLLAELDSMTSGCSPFYRRGRAWGELYRQLGFLELGEWVSVDLFLATPETFGYLLALRTGPADFSRKLVTARRFGGAVPDGLFCAGGRVRRALHRSTIGDWVDVETAEESDFFELLGLPCWPPARRSVELLNVYLKGNSDADSIAESGRND